MRAALACVLLSFALSAFGTAMPPVHSQPPSPTPTKSVEQPNSDPAKKQQDAGSAQSSAHQPALTATPSQSRQPATSDHPDKERDYTSAEWWMVYITGALAAITGILAWYTAGLWSRTKALVGQAKTESDRQFAQTEVAIGIARGASEQQARDMQASLAHAEISANAAKDAAEAASKHVKTAVNVDRPFVYASNVDLRSRIQAIAANVDGMPQSYDVSIHFTNHGRTPAFVTRVGFGYAVAARPPIEPVYEQLPVLNDLIVIPAGEPHEFGVTDFPHYQLVIEAGERPAMAAADRFLWLWGNIIYGDVFNGTAETGFVGIYYPDPFTGIFRPGNFRFGRIAEYTYLRYKEDGEEQTAE